MKKIIVMMVVIAITISMMVGCSNGNETVVYGQDYVERFCELNGRTLVSYEGVVKGVFAEDQYVFRYVAVDNETGRTYSCDVDMDYVINTVERDIDINKA